MGGEIIKEIVALRPNMHSYLTGDGCVDKKAKTTKKCVIKREIEFQDYKECLKNNKTILKNQQRLRIETHNVFIKKVNKIALSANDDKIETPDGVISYTYGIGARRVCKAKLMRYPKLKN